MGVLLHVGLTIWEKRNQLTDEKSTHEREQRYS